MAFGRAGPQVTRGENGRADDARPQAYTPQPRVPTEQPPNHARSSNTLPVPGVILPITLPFVRATTSC